jgi:hypothetical protein
MVAVAETGAGEDLSGKYFITMVADSSYKTEGAGTITVTMPAG